MFPPRRNLPRRKRSRDRPVTDSNRSCRRPARALPGRGGAAHGRRRRPAVPGRCRHHVTGEFYERLPRARRSTAALPPGRGGHRVRCWRRRRDRDPALSNGSNTSATVNAASVAAGSEPGAGGDRRTRERRPFAVACCVWAAGEALAAGGATSPTPLTSPAACGGSRCGGTCPNRRGVSTSPRRGGRPDRRTRRAGEGLPVLAPRRQARCKPSAAPTTSRPAVDATITTHLLAEAAGRLLPQRVGVGDAALTPDLAGEHARPPRRPARGGRELVRYDIGPARSAPIPALALWGRASSRSRP